MATRQITVNKAAAILAHHLHHPINLSSINLLVDLTLPITALHNSSINLLVDLMLPITALRNSSINLLVDLTLPTTTLRNSSINLLVDLILLTTFPSSSNMEHRLSIPVTFLNHSNMEHRLRILVTFLNRSNIIISKERIMLSTLAVFMVAEAGLEAQVCRWVATLLMAIKQVLHRVGMAPRAGMADNRAVGGGRLN